MPTIDAKNISFDLRACKLQITRPRPDVIQLAAEEITPDGPVHVRFALGVAQLFSLQSEAERLLLP